MTGQEVEAEDVAIDAVAGAITLTALEPRRARVATESADVDLALELKSLDDLSVESGTGDVVLRVRQQLGYDIRAESKSGELKALGVELDVLERTATSSHLRHGAGGPVLQVAAAGGSVTVRPFEASRLDLVVGDSGKPRNSLARK